MSGWIQLRRLYEEAAAARQRMLLFSLVGIAGSSYRKLGAHMLVTEDGRRAGSVSAGCIESDLLTRVSDFLTATLPQILSYDNRDDDVFALNGGCTGALTILVQELQMQPAQGTEPEYGRRPTAPLNPITAYIQASADRTSVYVETNIDAHSPKFGHSRYLSEGSAPCGHRVSGTGELQPAQPHQIERATQAYIQTIEPPIRLVIFGAQTDAFSLLQLADNIDMETVMVDWRAALLSSSLQRGSKIKLQGDELASVSHDRRTAVVIMSHNYEQDRAALASMLDAPVGYLGVMGPRARTEKMLAEIAQHTRRSSATAFGAPLYYPVGLDIGADNADEIAVAIVAEILSVFRQATGAPLAGKPTAIHAPVP